MKFKFWENKAAAPLVLVLILVTGFALRLAVLPFKGYEPDVALSKTWGLELVKNGFERLSDLPNSPINYFPNYALLLYVYKGIAAGYLRFISPTGDFDSWIFTALIKSPGVFGDLVLALLLFFWARRFFSGSRALLAPIIYLFNPGVFYDTAVWGQVDSLHTLFALGALLAWFSGRRTFSGVLLAAALMTKVHAVIYVPLLLLLMVQRAGAWNAAKKYLPAAAATFVFAVLPYLLALGPVKIFSGSLGSVAKYPFITVNAMNVWWPFSRIMGGFVRDDVGLVPPVLIGFMLFAVAYVAVFEAVRGKTSELRVLEAAALLTLVFFLFPTEIHERYLFPFFAFAAIPALADRVWRYSFIALSASFLVNMLFAAASVTEPWLPFKMQDVMPLVDLWYLVNIVVFVILARRFFAGRTELYSKYETSAHRPAGA